MKRSRHMKADWLQPTYPKLRRSPPEFQPAYTPYRMMKLGVFGGNYFAAAKRRDFAGMSDATEKRARENVVPFSARNNCFGVAAGLSYQEWYDRGWMHDDDPLGWFHWYCRYFNGRRHPDDNRQIDRWLRYRQRWGDRLRSQFEAGRPSAVVMQGLLQWSIDPYLGRD